MADTAARTRARARAAAARARTKTTEPAEAEAEPAAPEAVTDLTTRRDPIADRITELEAAYAVYDAAVQRAWNKCNRLQQEAWDEATSQVDAAAIAYTSRVSQIRGDW